MPIETIDPATGQRVRVFAPHTAADVEQRLARAAAAARAWRDTPTAERARVVARAGARLDDDRERYARLMTLEMGKLIGAARDEAAKCAAACRFYAEHAHTILAPKRVPVDGEQARVEFHPLGVVLAVMPWNFPFWQVIRFAAPALVAGNVALLKHASNVPQCALALEALFADAGAPPGVFQTLLIPSADVAGLLADPRVAAATLTGSEDAGSQVAMTAGRHLKKTVLELGGSDPFIVMPSADLDRAVETAVRARTVNNGQSCIAAKRFIVHEAVADAFTERFVRAMAALIVGHPMDDRTQVGPLASPRLAADLEAQVRRSVELGARVLTGGRRIDGAGSYFQPTVLADVPPGSPAYADELFGPVASLFRARDLDDAIRIANDTRFGLGASAWTRDAAEARRLARDLEAGSVFVNAMVASDPRFPFGGVKTSGYGRELSGFGLREFVNVKTVRVRL
ncbi:MAG TPA: NAD-dependent succinate-semialdehyde dehydrogenase [Gemmatimonadaceae bacterium]|nr:NAD-dependent succinate-semialdehyde dehydrogenase [Gemmatimonadaceae bacterium]